jgi:hypothetical protein
VSVVTAPVASSLPHELRKPLDHLSSVLSGLFGESFLGLTVFGPCLDGRSSAGDSIETVAVISRVDLQLVRRLAEHAAELGRRGFTAPLLMTPDYIAASLDTFPLELIEIHQHHATATGRDYFDQLTINSAHVRLQCEREFKRIQMRIRQGLLASGGQEALLEALELDIGRHALRTLRGYLWLKGQREYLAPDAVIAECGRLVSRSLAGISNAIHTGGEHGWTELVALYDDVEALAAAANHE